MWGTFAEPGRRSLAPSVQRRPLDPDYVATGSMEDDPADIGALSDDEASGARTAAEASATAAVGGEEELPRVLGERYRLEALIAAGGMGRVYRATQLPLMREVAVKVMVAPPTAKTEFRRRFLLEASVCARLKHPNIVIVHDYGETDAGELYMTMELLDGEPLKDLLKREGPLEPLRAIHIALQIARALRDAHAEGIAHRDLKPGNVFVDRQLIDDEHEVDAVKVLDFGLVKVYEDERPDVEEDVTGEDVMLGSPRYMSPEQILCEPVDARSDIYSFGALLFAMLGGRPPFVGRSAMEVMHQHLKRPPPDFASTLTKLDQPPGWKVPTALEAVVHRCLQKEVDDRYQDVEALIQALKDVRNELDGGTGQYGALTSDSGLGPPTRLSAPASDDDRRRVPFWLPMALLLVVGAVAIALTALPREPEPEPRAAEPAPEPEPEPEPEPSPEPTVEEPAMVSVTINSEPPGADVISGGVLLGRTPLVRELPPTPDGAQRMLELRLDGYETTRVARAIAGDSVEIQVELTQTPQPTPTPRRRRATRMSTSMMRAPTVDDGRVRIPIVD